jgi:hypothetical protein
MPLPSIPRREFFRGLAALGIAPVILPAVGSIGTSSDSCEGRPCAGRIDRRGNKHAVYRAHVSGFRPENVADQPTCFAGAAELVARGLTLKGATRRSHQFNRQQLAEGLPIREWAFVLSYCRPQIAAAAGRRAQVDADLVAKVEACYLAAGCMSVPRHAGIEAPAWWQALLVAVYNTGLRHGELLHLRIDQIDWDGGGLTLRPPTTSSRSAIVMPLHPAAIAHLRKIRRTDGQLLFPWPHTQACFYRQLHKLQDAAGIDPTERFSLHDVRRIHFALRWDESSPAGKPVDGLAQPAAFFPASPAGGQQS